MIEGVLLLDAEGRVLLANESLRRDSEWAPSHRGENHHGGVPLA